MAAGRVRTKSQRWWVAAVALAAFLGWEIQHSRFPGEAAEQPLPVAPTATTLVSLGENRSEGGESATNPTVTRPTGNPAPWPAPVAQQPAASGRSVQHGQVVLLGTTIADDGSFALVTDAAAARSRVLRKGDRVDGLLVTEIRPDRLELTDGATGELVILKVDDEARPGGYSAAPQAAGPVPMAVSQSNVMSAAASPPMVPEYAEPSPSEEDQPASSSH